MIVIKKAYYVMIGLFFLFLHSTYCQNQKISDSLIQLYKAGNFGENEMQILRAISEDETNPDKRLYYSELLINKALKDSVFEFILGGYLQKGNAHQLIGNNIEALDAFLQSIKYAYRINDQKSIGQISIAIADTYTVMNNSVTAQNYYEKGIEILRRQSDSVALGTALLNAGDSYFNTENFTNALQYFKESSHIFKNLNYPIGTAYNKGNIGMVYAEQGKHTLAEQNINEAINILEELKDYYPISVYLTYMADIYAKRGEMQTALNYSHRSLDLATQYGLKDQISDANLNLSELYEEAGNKDASLKHYKAHIVYRDSVRNIEAVQQMADLRTDHEVSQKQIEVDLLNEKKKTQKIILFATMIALALIAFLAMGLFKRNKYIKKTSKIIENEKERSDNLLLNILPTETAEELKTYGKVKAKRFESVSVLFTDFEGFTKYSEHLSPEALVETIDYYFSKFDEIIEKYDLEKIKTIGDAYMCAGGLPFPTDDHAKRTVLAAFEIAAFVDEIQKAVDKKNLNFNVRIGINTGPVVAGVVGSKKFAYDIWGDTVNIASRMESKSGLGKINVSENTYQLIKDDFECEYRGEIDAKNKGMMRMYFVNSIKTNSSATKILEHVESRS